MTSQPHSILEMLLFTFPRVNSVRTETTSPWETPTPRQTVRSHILSWSSFTDMDATNHTFPRTWTSNGTLHFSPGQFSQVGGGGGSCLPTVLFVDSWSQSTTPTFWGLSIAWVSAFGLKWEEPLPRSHVHAWYWTGISGPHHHHHHQNNGTPLYQMLAVFPVFKEGPPCDSVCTAIPWHVY